MVHNLIVSSQVIFGHVGLSAMVPALHALGQPVAAFPTVLLSHHPGHNTSTGHQISCNDLDQALEALSRNGELSNISTVITGYLPTPEHVAFAVRAIETTRANAKTIRVLCDPILGDDPTGLYIDPDAARAIRDTLLPRADIITPNRFELAWLSGRDITDIQSTEVAAQQLGLKTIIATSIPNTTTTLGTLLVSDSMSFCVNTKKRTDVPHGTGDLLTGLFAGHLNCGRSPHDSLKRAVAGVDIAISESLGNSDLNLIPHLDTIIAATMD